jgi:hypothetical protein
MDAAGRDMGLAGQMKDIRANGMVGWTRPSPRELEEEEIHREGAPAFICPEGGAMWVEDGYPMERGGLYYLGLTPIGRQWWWSPGFLRNPPPRWLRNGRVPPRGAPA